MSQYVVSVGSSSLIYKGLIRDLFVSYIPILMHLWVKTPSCGPIFQTTADAKAKPKHIQIKAY